MIRFGQEVCSSLDQCQGEEALHQGRLVSALSL